MPAHSLVHDEAQRSLVRRSQRKDLLQLGWFHFWVLAGVLGGILGLVAMVFAVQTLRS